MPSPTTIILLLIIVFIYTFIVLTFSGEKRVVYRYKQKPVSPATRKRMSESAKRRWLTKPLIVTEEARKKMSESAKMRKRWPLTPEHKKAISNWIKKAQWKTK